MAEEGKWTRGNRGFKLPRNPPSGRVQYHGTTLRGGRTAHWEIDHLRSKVWRSTAINDEKFEKQLLLIQN